MEKALIIAFIHPFFLSPSSSLPYRCPKCSAPKAQSQPRFPIFLSLPLSPPASSFLLFHPLSLLYNKEQKNHALQQKSELSR